ncbi:AI-2E family transporter [Bryobacterales bacterium F-183]|nr:AI-2E family transporter [Bryobacterales bacterium F-183]
MLGLDAKAAKSTWTAFLVLLAIYLAYEARGPIVVLLLAVFFAYLLAPAVDFFTRFFHEDRARIASLAVVYFLMVGILTAGFILIGTKVAEEATALASRLPEYIERGDPLANLPIPEWLAPMRVKITTAAREQLKHLEQGALPLITAFLTTVLSQAGNILTAVLIPILAFFILKDGKEIRHGLLSLAATEQQRDFLDTIFDGMHQLLGNYIRALLGLVMSTLIIYTLYFEITSVPYAILLGALSAALEFIPVVGPLIASVTILIVAGASGYQHILAILVFLIVFRLFQDYVLQPYLMGQGVELHPLLVLFGVLAGEKIAGIPGMFFSVPLIAALRIIYFEVQKRRQVQAEL